MFLAREITTWAEVHLPKVHSKSLFRYSMHKCFCTQIELHNHMSRWMDHQCWCQLYQKGAKQMTWQHECFFLQHFSQPSHSFFIKWSLFCELAVFSYQILSEVKKIANNLTHLASMGRIVICFNKSYIYDRSSHEFDNHPRRSK